RSVSRHQYQKGHALALLHEILQQIFSLFQTHVSLGVWEESHVERVLAALHQQLKYVESLAGLKAEQKSGGLTVENLRLQIKAYFRRIHDYLENQRYSSCAWIIVQDHEMAEQTRNGPLNTVKQEPTVEFKSIGNIMATGANQLTDTLLRDSGIQQNSRQHATSWLLGPTSWQTLFRDSGLRQNSKQHVHRALSVSKEEAAFCIQTESLELLANRRKLKPADPRNMASPRKTIPTHRRALGMSKGPLAFLL
ncbi:hypothetical protein A6R68_15785, partial [Neotoma lepida]